jgi:huntingtin interacting protein 1
MLSNKEYCFFNCRDAADEVVSGKGKVEFVMVAAQEISASTAQLVVASRVKAERSSTSLSALTDASRGVTQATATVVTTAKACVQLVEQSGEIWFFVSFVSWYQRNTWSM